MRTSIIICTKDREADLCAAVDSLLTQVRHPDELIIVDAGTDAALGQRIQDRIGDIFPLRYVTSSPGLTRQRNVGIAQSAGDVLVFIDDDVVLTREFLSSIATVFEQDTALRIHAVLGRIINTLHAAVPEQQSLKHRLYYRVIKLITRTFLLSDENGDGHFKRSGLPTFPYQSAEPGIVECLAGGLMAFRRDVFTDIGFDERFTGYCFMEDVDIARNLHQHGYTVYYEPHASLVHNMSPASRTRDYYVSKMRVLNHHYLYKKYPTGSAVTALAFAWSLAGFLAISACSLRPVRVVGTLAGIGCILAGCNSLVRQLRAQQTMPHLPVTEAPHERR